MHNGVSDFWVAMNRYAELGLAAIAAVLAAMPVYARPVCYMEWQGQIIDLSPLCVSDQARPVAAPRVTEAQGVRLVVYNSSFDNQQWDSVLGRYVETATISGPLYNFGDRAARDVVVEAKGTASGRTPQTRRVTINELTADNSVSVEFNFDFGVPVESWDVRVISYAE